MMLNLHDIVKVTESAAIACYDYIGKGNEKLADKIAVDAMRASLNEIEFKARIVIGEGERDKAPMLYIGEEVGSLTNLKKEVQYDIAVDPLEGTTICAKAMPGALSVLSITQHHGMLHAPDVYMDKMASNIPDNEQVIDLDESIRSNLTNLAKFKKCDVSDLKIIMLDRARHQETISKIRELKAQIQLISDGDIAAVIAVASKKADLYMGIGGAPEGVLAAAALKTLGGQFVGRLHFNDEAEKERAHKLGIQDLYKKYNLNDLVSKDAVFCATGVTSGPLLNGVERLSAVIYKTNSLILNSKTKEIIKLESTREKI